jgi:hypothetical protein
MTLTNILFSAEQILYITCDNLLHFLRLEILFYKNFQSLYNKFCYYGFLGYHAKIFKEKNSRNRGEVVRNSISLLVHIYTTIKIYEGPKKIEICINIHARKLTTVCGTARRAQNRFCVCAWTIDISYLKSLKVVYLWRHVSSTAPPFILWWWNLETLFAPLNRSSPFIGELRCQAIQMEHALI